MLRWVRARSPRSHPPSGDWLADSDGIAALAPWMKSIRRYLFPRLLMPSNFGLPPVVCCLGTSPSQAPRSRPRLNAAPLPTAATRAVALSTPTPGIVTRRRAASSWRAMATNSHLDAVVQRLPFAADIDDRLSDAAADLTGRIGHQCVYCRFELASSLGKDVTTFEQDRPKLVQQRASDPN